MEIFFLISGGLVLLFMGGEVLVRGAVALANHVGVPTLVVGLTVVAFGTSAPELVVSIQATLTDHPNIALGNIFGSNISNILLVMGVSAAIYPIAIDPSIIKRDSPILILLTIIIIIFCWTNYTLEIWEGVVLTISLILYLSYTVLTALKGGKKDTSHLEEEIKEELPADISNISSLVHIAIGIAMLAYGANILVDGSVQLATMFGISEGVIGLTIVAIGSSAPELATCIIAAYRKHSDIIAGNIIGSNLLNIMAGLGIAAMIKPLSVSDEFFIFDIWFMLAATLVMALIIHLRAKISKTVGLIFVLSYIGYIAIQFMKG